MIILPNYIEKISKIAQFSNMGIGHQDMKFYYMDSFVVDQLKENRDVIIDGILEGKDNIVVPYDEDSITILSMKLESKSIHSKRFISYELVYKDLMNEISIYVKMVLDNTIKAASTRQIPSCIIKCHSDLNVNNYRMPNLIITGVNNIIDSLPMVSMYDLVRSDLIDNDMVILTYRPKGHESGIFVNIDEIGGTYHIGFRNEFEKYIGSFRII